MALQIEYLAPLIPQKWPQSLHFPSVLVIHPISDHIVLFTFCLCFKVDTLNFFIPKWLLLTIAFFYSFLRQLISISVGEVHISAAMILSPIF